MFPATRTVLNSKNMWIVVDCRGFRGISLGSKKLLDHPRLKKKKYPFIFPRTNAT